MSCSLLAASAFKLPSVPTGGVFCSGSGRSHPGSHPCPGPGFQRQLSAPGGGWRSSSRDLAAASAALALSCVAMNALIKGPILRQMRSVSG